LTLAKVIRRFGPFLYGLKGGESGKRGVNLFIEKHGFKINLGGKNEVNVQLGDRLRIETPGAGGYGKK